MDHKENDLIRLLKNKWKYFSISDYNFTPDGWYIDFLLMPEGNAGMIPRNESIWALTFFMKSVATFNGKIGVNIVPSERNGGQWFPIRVCSAEVDPHEFASVLHAGGS